MTLPIYRGWEQHGKGREAADKGTGSGRAEYRRREVLTPVSPPQCNGKKTKGVRVHGGWSSEYLQDKINMKGNLA